MERLLLALVSMLLRFQGILIITLGAAALSSWLFSSMPPGQREPWIEVMSTWALKTALTFLPLGFAVLILAPSRLSSTEAQPARPELVTVALKLLPVALIGLAILSIIAASPVIAVWGEALQRLNAAGVWKELGGTFGDPMGGIALMPFIAAALIAFLELAPAASMVAGSAALLCLYVAKAGNFPRAFLACVLIQGAFVAASFYLLDLTAYLSAFLREELSGNLEVRTVVEWVQRHEAAVKPATGYVAVLFFGYAAWVPLLFGSSKEQSNP